MFPYEKPNLSKKSGLTGILISVIGLMSIPNSASAHNFCSVQNSSGQVAWDLEDNGSKIIPFELTAGDVWTPIEQVTSASIRGKHQYTGDMAAELRSPDGTNVVLFRLGDGRYGESFSSCSRADFDITFSDTHPGQDLSVSSENDYCTGTNNRGGEGVWPQPYLPNFPNVGSSPAINATVRTYNSEGMSSNRLSNFVGDEPLGGSWGLFVEDAYAQDVGTVEEACVDMDFGSVTYDIWVSSDATCSDTLDSGTFQEGDTVHVCYVTSNEATENFELQSEANDHGQTLTELSGAYSAKFGGSATVKTAVRSFVAGDSILPVGTTQLSGSVTVEGTDTFFSSGETLTTPEMVTITVTPANVSLAMIKEADDDTDRRAGEVITYTYTVTNDGDEIVRDITISDAHNGSDAAPTPSDETLLTDVVPLGDSTDAATNGSWDVLGVGDSITFTGTYTVTVTDVENL